MSAADRVRYYAALADADATRSGRRDHRVAARELHKLAERLEATAIRERHKKRRQRAQQSLALDEHDQGDDGQAVSPDASGDTLSEHWRAVRRTPESVTLRRR